VLSDGRRKQRIESSASKCTRLFLSLEFCLLKHQPVISGLKKQGELLLWAKGKKTRSVVDNSSYNALEAF
jgi:hypothetical protein